MQYHSCFNSLGSDQQPTVLFFDNEDPLPELSEDNVESLVRTARSSLGLGNVLNPVRGQSGEKYFLTYAKYGRSNGLVTPAESNTALAAVKSLGSIGPLISDPAITDGVYKSITQVIGNPIRTPILLPELPINTINCPTYEYIATYSQGGGHQATAGAGATETTPTQMTYTAPTSPAYGDNRQRTSAPVFTVDGLTQPFLDYPVRAVKLGGNSGSISLYSNAGDGLAYSPDVIKEQDEVVNLDVGYMFMDDNVCVLRKDLDFTTDENLVPGTRPYIDFSITHTDL